MKYNSNIDLQSIVTVINTPTPVASTDVANKAYVDSAIEGLAWKDGCRVATQSNISIASPGATIDGVTMVANDRVLVKSQTSQIENGIYLWSGAASALVRTYDAQTSNDLEQAIVTVEEGTSAGASFRQTTVNFTVGVGNVVWTSFGTAAPTATTSTPGIAAIATQTQVDTGTDNTTIVTPLTLATWANRVKKFVAQIGDGSSTQYDITHNFGTRSVNVQVRRTVSPWDQIIVDNQAFTTNTVRLVFATAPTTNQFEVTVIA